MIKERVFPHFRHPRGLYGWVAGRIMATRATNVQRNLWIAGLLDPAPTAQILEIGHGPGLAIEQLWPRLTTGHITGVDVSGLMTRTAGKRNRAGVEAGRVSFRTADATALPADLRELDLIFGVNVAQFWADPESVLADLADRLVPGGELVLVYMSPPGVDVPAEQVVDELARRFETVGLTDVHRDTMDFDPPATAVRATRAVAVL